MSIERILDSTPSIFEVPGPLFGGSGHPNVKTTPWSPETAEFMRPLMEAERLRMEAQMNTPEGRKKAREMRRAELIEKKKNWAFRVIYDRGNGWKPIWGSAKDEELRIYTLVDSGPGEQHRFWGIKPIGMDIDQFWDKYDPEVKRWDDRQQETPVNPDAPVGPLIGEPPRNLTTKEAAAKPVKRQKTPDINSNRRVRRPIARSRKPGVNRKKRAKTVSSSQQKQATEYEGSAHFKYPGEHPASKAKADESRPLAPSIHEMHTRGKGPAEMLRLP